MSRHAHRLLAFTALALVACALVVPAAAHARTLDVPFPRTALWWPDTNALPLSGLARYDLLILGDYDRAKVPQLRALHPDQLLLDSTNACELDYDPYNAAANAELARVPAEWVLTQVGSTLAAPLSATATSVRVNAVTGPGGLTLFDAGDAVVIDGEIAYVWDVDPASKTLFLRRGAVKGATTHAAGARVAAAISFWGRDLVMDLSTDCPLRTAESGAGPETWASYNARRGAALLASADWDGLLTDRSDGDESWLIGRSSARSIDPLRDNALPSSYASFDSSWNAGLRAYEQRLRSLVGQEAVLIGNWARPNYDVLDGDVFEAFPQADGTSYNGTWRQTTFGPLNGFGGYLEWMAKARQPAVGVIAAYDNDGPYLGAEPQGATTAKERWRKARFGLGTALLGDGFFAYEFNSEGRGASALSWFDGYDAGGAGAGYLGMPKGPAEHALPPLTTPDLVSRGGFDSEADLAAWELMVNAGYTGSVTLDDAAGSPGGGAAAEVTLSTAAGTAWQAHLTSGDVGAIAAGQEYTLSFWAKADRERAVSLWLQGDRDDTRVLADFGEESVGTGWRNYEVSVRAQASSGSAGTRLHFGVGSSAGRVWLDDVHLRRGTTAVWRRDFDDGTVVVNGTASTQTVQVGEGLRAIAGTQDRAVDDGLPHAAVTLPPLDARVLIGAPAPSPAAAASVLRDVPALWRAVAAESLGASRRCATEAASASGRRRDQLLAAAARWRASSALALHAADAADLAMTALDGEDVAAGRRALASADAASHAAIAASAVIDPLRGRDGRRARLDALTAAASVHDAVAALH